MTSASPDLLTLPLELLREIALSLEYRDLVRFGRLCKLGHEVFGDADLTGLWRHWYHRELSDKPCPDERYRQRYLEVKQGEQRMYPTNVAILGAIYGYDKLITTYFSHMINNEYCSGQVIDTALKNSHYDLAYRLITSGLRWEWYNCVEWAAANNRPDIIDFVLKFKFNQDRDQVINQTLHLSARTNNIPMIDYALNHGSNQINWALESAAHRGARAAVNRLIPLATPQGLRRALRTAYSNRYTRIAKRLLRAGATWFAADAPEDPEDDDNLEAVDEPDESDDEDNQD